MFKVTKPEVLSDGDKQTILNKEGLWFYHSYIRTELELLDIAHNRLLCTGQHNYKQTREYREIESILHQLYTPDNKPDKIRLNCPFTGKFEWYSVDDMHETYSDLIDKLAEYLTESHDIEGYYVCYYEGEWGLWPTMEDC